MMSFCLTNDESIRVRERLTKIDIANSILDAEIQELLLRHVEDSVQLQTLVELTRATTNHYLLRRGEAFASAITNNKPHELGAEDLRISIEHVLRERLSNYSAPLKTEVVQMLFATITDLFSNPTTHVQNHLRSKADAYTLLAFLGQTPDVQGAVSKMFSHGTIWLDTTIVLPLFAEHLVSSGQRRFTQMLNMASAVGLGLRVTPGVVEEVERHINRCVAYVSVWSSTWSGNVPFLIDAYSLSGRGLASFSSWIEYFQGQERPEDDLAEYLLDTFGISREGLEEDEKRASQELRTAVQEAWIAAHTKRRAASTPVLDDIALNRLARHDVENYVGVIERRRRDGDSPLGYSAWWLTLDRSAQQVRKDVHERLGRAAPPSPVMSADFLVNYLSMGPIRSKVNKVGELGLPIGLDIDGLEGVPGELLLEAEKIRRDSGDLAEHIIRRRVRDHLDSARRRHGRISEEGLRTVLETIKESAH